MVGVDALSACNTNVAKILQKSLEGREVSVEDGERLFTVTGADFDAAVHVANELRQRVAPDQVTYVVNRNINFTNVCVKRCGFCAFSRGHRAEEGYYLPVEEIVRRANEAWQLGATEVCVQAGLPPRMKGSIYIDLCRAIKAELPGIHVHGFSPEEVLYGAERSGCSVEEYLAGLKEAGVGSLPGTSAEILDDRVRDLISPGRITTADWTRVIRGAHLLAIPTTSTIMYGHVETARHCAEHIALIREIQKETGGFTEFVPLSFIHSDAPMYQKSLVPGLRPGATREEVIRMYAVARIMLHGSIHHIQASWVKQGIEMAKLCLQAGADDLGGTLMNESISTAAGAGHGHFMRPVDLRTAVREIGRIPVERTTTYQTLRVMDHEPDRPEPLDASNVDGNQFGSYHSLIGSGEFRYKTPHQPTSRPAACGADSATPLAKRAPSTQINPPIATVIVT
jgi:7,8-didemethyl-8-hydroxy-5-deazariboflavin synthase CofH subunit